MKKDYSNYNWEDLIQDQQFVDWVKDPSDTSGPDWKKLFVENPGLENQANKAIQMLRLFKFENLANDKAAQDRLWNRIDQSMDAQEGKQLLKWKSKSIWWALAAASLFLFVVFRDLILSSNEVVLDAPYAMKLEKTLPDGSKVMINSGSNVSYQGNSFRQNRILKLEGEAFFSIEKGTAFEVQSPSGIVKVLGTEFNVFDREGKMEVHCFSGKVSVQFHQSNQVHVLLPGEKVTNYNTSESKNFETKAAFNPVELKFWKDGVIYYENAALVEVLKEFQRQYAIKAINLSPEMGQLRYTGFFNIRNMEEAIQSISVPMQLKFELKDGSLTVSKE
ncbi:MAG: FecR domain-containing protein [Saprospiraceae bacterium]|nr:FecR domain-containing protein [Saprospiraceae bacterium]